LVGIAGCYAMNAKHLLRQRVGVLSSSGTDERFTVK
jgi:hypothetical protein